jgi:hypothetical protein
VVSSTILSSGKAGYWSITSGWPRVMLMYCRRCGYLKSHVGGNVSVLMVMIFEISIGLLGLLGLGYLILI